MDAGKRTTNAAGPVPGSRPSELDLNSGDLHGLVSYSDGHRQYADYESRLSKEVRRLGIPIPKERNWQPLSARYRLDLLHAADLLLDLLDEGNAIDQDRQSVLEKFMANMRTEGLPGAVGKAHELIQEFADQHGLKGPFQTWRTEDLRRRINARSATQPER